MTFYLGGSNLTSQPYFGSSLISKIYKGASLIWEYLVGGDAYEATNSLDFQPNDYLVRTPTVVGNRKTWTFSTWVKRTNLSFTNGHIFESAASPQYTGAYFNSSNQIQFRAFSGSFIWSVVTNEKVADAQWHHLVFMYDSTQATEADRIKVYLDGTATTYASATYPALNADSNINNTTAQYIGTQTGSSGSLEAYLADVHMIDGQALDATSFAESSAVYGWQPKEYSGSYGTNGFHLKFIYANKPGADVRGSNDFTWNGTGSIEGFGSTGVTVEDPYFNNVSLLLHMDGTDGGTTFTDSSANGFVQSANSASLSTSDSAYGTTSGDFTTNGYTVKFANDPAFRFGTGDFTIEGWFKPTGTGSSKSVCGLGTNTADGFTLFVSPGQVIFRASGTTDLTVNSLTIGQSGFTHIAWVRSGNTRSIFVDGVLVGSDTLSFNVTNTANPFALGSLDTSGSSFRYIGYIDEFRVTKGVARYTSNFIPQNAPFADSAVDPYFNNVSLLLPMDGTNGSTTFTDESNNALTVTTNGDSQISTTESKFGGASGYFDGNGDYVQATLSSSFNPRTDSFTIEGWMRLDADYSTWVLACDTNSKIYMTAIENTVYVGDGTTNNISVAHGMSTGVWHHMATTFDGTTYRAFRDGTLLSSSTTLLLSNSVSTIDVGGRPSQSQYTKGYIDDFRLTIGVARYTSDFTPPFGPHSTALPSSADPYINNVALLLHMNGPDGSTIFTDDSSNALAVTAGGNAQISTTESKFGGASGFFDGTGDSITIPANTGFSFDGDFTIEFWVRPAASTYGAIMQDVTGTNFSGGKSLILWDHPNELDKISLWDEAIFNAGAGSSSLVESATLNINTWYHIAFVRSGTTITAYTNGVASAGTYTTSGTLDFSTGGTEIGKWPGGAFNGYLDDFRVTKGVARYTANFVPQDAPFEDAVTDGYFDDVSLLLHMDGTNGSTVFIDNSSNAFTVTPIGDAQISTAQSKFGGASCLFDGTGDWLNISDTSALRMESGDFTIEFWIYFNSIASYQTPFDKGYTDANGIVLQTGNGTGRMIVYIGGAAVITESGTGSTGSWIHYALVRSGTSLTLYRDGVSSGTTTDSTNLNSTDVFTIGRGATGVTNKYPVNGYIDEFRVTKGVARYTSDFIPQNAPFPNFSPSTEAWTPSQTATRLWIDADDASTITETANAVSQWNDKSGNGFHFVQATGSEQPTLTANGLNSKPVITFASDHMDAPGYAITTQPFTIIFIATGDGSGSFSYVYDTATTRVIFAFEESNNARNSIYAGTAWLSNNNAILDTNPHIFTANYNGASSSLDVDDVGSATGDPGSASITNGMTLGKHNNGSDHPINGYIAELIIVEDATGPLIEKIQGYLAHKWGLTANLPSNHPYKTSAP